MNDVSWLHGRIGDLAFCLVGAGGGTGPRVHSPLSTHHSQGSGLGIIIRGKQQPASRDQERPPLHGGRYAKRPQDSGIRKGKVVRRCVSRATTRANEKSPRICVPDSGARELSGAAREN